MAKVYTTSKTIEYTGALPIMIKANGSALADYRIYGAVSGVGDRTENIYDFADMSYGYESGRALSVDGTTTAGSNWCVSSYIEVKPSVTYTINWYVGIPYQSFMCEYDENYNFIGSVPEELNKTFTTSSQTKYLRLSNTYRNVERSRRETCVLVEGPTAPAKYEPYGYEVDMSVSDGTTSTTTPIYIGSDPLGEDEYVSYGEQKVYRRTEQLFNAETAVYKNGVYKNDSGVEASYPGAGYYKTYTPIAPEETIYVINVHGSQVLTVRLYFYDAQKQWISRTDGYTGAFSVVTPSNAAYAQLQISQQFIPSLNTITITQGSTAPSTYIPYLQPTDPPVPLPALPTMDGETTFGYDGGEPQPEQMYVKYNSFGGWVDCVPRVLKDGNWREQQECIRRNGVWVRQT